MSSALEIAREPAWPWWTLSAGLFGGAFLCVLAWVAFTHSGANRFGSASPIVVAGAAFQLVRGGGHPEQSSFIVESASDEVAALSVEVKPFPAANYPRIEWVLRTAQPPDGLAFVWRTRENPRRTNSKPLRWLAGSVAPMSLGDSDGWRGTITGLGLVARGPLPAPIEVHSVRLPAATVRGTLAEILRQWTAPVPLQGYAISFPFDAERAHFLPLAQAVAITIALAMAVYFFLARWRGWPSDARVFWAVFAVGWILLDARWQVDLGREVAGAIERFAGKSPEQKALAADDAAVYVLAQDLRRGLPSPPARVIVLCDNRLIAVRIAYFLYPHNVSRNMEIEDVDHVLPPKPGSLRSGDYVALVFYNALGFDAEKQTLVWPDGRTQPAEMIVRRPDFLLARVR